MKLLDLLDLLDLLKLLDPLFVICLVIRSVMAAVGQVLMVQVMLWGGVWAQSFPDHGLCQSISIPLCADLAYNQTILPNLLGHTHQEEAGLEVHQFYPLVQARCSAELHLFLCALYVPVCTLLLRPLPPCRALCEQARRGCEPLMNRFGFPWPERLRCDAFPARGANNICVGPDAPEDSTPTSHLEPAAPPPHSCPPPLQVPAHLNSHFLGVAGCGTPCDLFFGEEELQLGRVWVGVWSAVCGTGALITLLTYLLDLRRFGYPERPIVFLSTCCLMVALAHGAGVLLGDSVACTGEFKEDGSKMAAQGVRSARCAVLFTMIYFFGMASAAWWVILALAWFLSASRKWGPEAIEARSQYFHLVAWAAPAIQTIAILATGQVEGDPLSGVCYVGVYDLSALRTFVLAPLTTCLLTASCFLFATVVSLFRIHAAVKRGGGGTEKLEKLIRRISAFSVLHTLTAAALLSCHLYEQARRPQWERTWLTQTCRHFAVPCPTGNAAPLTPHIGVFMVKYLVTLVGGVTSGLWAWSGKTLRSWHHVYKRIIAGKQGETTV